MQEMRTIEGFPDYAITRDGKVWSNKKKLFLKQRINKRNAYKYVDICNKEVRKTKSVHRLVALAYIPNPENNSTVDHINRIRIDNRVSNLRWVTQKENNANRVVGRGAVTLRSNRKKSWRLQWWANGKHKNKSFLTKQEVEAYRIIVYQLRCAIRRMRGLNY